MSRLTFDAIFNAADEDRLPHIVGSIGLCLGIAAVDWKVLPNVSLGLFYIFPVLIASLVIKRPQIALLALGCSFFREQFSPFAWQAQWGFRLAIVWIAFTGAGWFVAEYRRNRLQSMRHQKALAAAFDLRHQQEQLLRAVVETSPLSILVLDPQGLVQLANRAASHLFGFSTPEEMTGASVGQLVPTLALSSSYADRDLKAAVECRAHTREGSAFLANVWFSTFESPSGRCLAAVIWDDSESLRTREVAHWETLVSSTSIALGSALHELRNYARQAAEVQQRLMENPALADSPELGALGTIVQGIQEIAAGGLRGAVQDSQECADLASVLEETRILAAPTLAEEGILCNVDLPGGSLLVRTGHQALLQVLLNLLRNARREMEGNWPKEVQIELRRTDRLVLLLVSNTGTPVRDPTRLFRPFDSGTNSAGLGLFVSRALMRSSGGDLRYEDRRGRPCFVIEMLAIPAAEGIAS